MRTGGLDSSRLSLIQILGIAAPSAGDLPGGYFAVGSKSFLERRNTASHFVFHTELVSWLRPSPGTLAVMSLPPERISVKRRREDAPIDTFYLEENHRAKKRSTAQAYHFRLLQASAIAPVSQYDSGVTQRAAAARQLRPQYDSNGIPTVRSTAPGDEIADFASLRQSQQPQVQPLHTAPSAPEKVETTSSKDEHLSTPALLRLAKNARRFHLTRNLSSSYAPSGPTGIRKSTARSSSIRPPLPTFIESQQLYDELYTKPPVDRLVSKPESEVAQAPGEPVRSDQTAPLAPFIKTKTPLMKTGVSVNDPMSSWDVNSDQLADELAALAMEMDSDTEAPSAAAPVISKTQQTKATGPPDDDFIYETYIRMPTESTIENQLTLHGDNFGVLVINEEDEDLWEGYMESEDDSEWDSEDSNGTKAAVLRLLLETDTLAAEDNPANDYPEDEVSSDDEYDRNAYRYFHGDREIDGGQSDSDRDND